MYFKFLKFSWSILILLSVVKMAHFAALARPKDWRSDHNKLYATKGESLKIEEISELLRSLSKIYSNSIYANDKYALQRKEKVSRLLDISNVDDSKCYGPTLAEMNHLLQYNSPYQVNIVPYIDFYRSKQMALCRYEITKNFERAISKMNLDEEKTLHDITNKITGNQQKLIHENLVVGLLDYLESKADSINVKSFLNKQNGLDNFRKTFIRYFTNACRPVELKLFPIIDSHKLLDIGEDFIASMDQKAHNWLSMTGFCKEVINKQDSLLEACHERLRLRNVVVTPIQRSRLNLF